MTNLFQHMPDGPGSLTAALLALLEHTDTALVNQLLRKAGVPHQVPPGSRLQVAFPAPGGPPEAGLVRAPDFALMLMAQGPGEDASHLRTDGGVTPLVVSLTGHAPAGGYALSWEQVDSLLAGTEEAYDAESRTAFLIQQFRDFLPSRGIQPFPGFPADELEEAPDALAALLQVYDRMDQFFLLLLAALAAGRQGLSELRQAGPTELLAGYPYRDYTDPALGSGLFLRVAFHLPERHLESSVWFTGGDPPAVPDSRLRLRDHLLGDGNLLPALRNLDEEPLLWLWSPDGERHIPLDEVEPDSLLDLDWLKYQVAVQRSLPLEEMAGEGAVGRTVVLVTELLATLAPVLTSEVH